MKSLKPAAVMVAAVTASLVSSLVGTAGAETGFQTGISQQHRPTWGTNLLPPEGTGDPKSGRVWATLTYGDISYIAGEFTAISPVIDRAGALDGASGLPTPGFPSIDKLGVINTAAPDGAGGWYIGGTFTNVAGDSRKGMARIAADGTLDGRWAPTLASNQATTGGALAVHALSKAGSHVYVGGEFTKFESHPARNRIARVSESTGTLDAAWNPDANGPVRAVAAAPDLNRIYIAGDFTALKGGTVPVPGFAALDSAGNVVPFSPGVGKVRSIAVSPDSTRVYTAGDSLAAIDAASGAVIWRHDGGGIASLTLSRDGTRLFAGGDFNALGGQPRAHLAAIDPATGTVDPSWIPDTNGNVSAVTVSDDGTKVFVGGEFSQVRGYARNRLAAVDAATGTLDAWDPNADGQINILSASGSQVYTSGTFGTLGAQPRSQLGAIDVTSGGPAGWAPQLRKLDSAGQPEAEPPVALALAMSSDATKIYVGGNFSHALGSNGEWLPRENLVAIDRVSGLADPNFNPGRVQGTVRSLAMFNASGRDILYAGGDFASVRISNTIQGSGRPDNPCPAGQNDCETLLNSAGKPNGSVSWKRPGLLAAFDAASGILEVDFDKVPASTGPGLIGQSGKACSGSECGNGAVKSIGVSSDGRFLYAGGTFSDLGGQLGMFSVNRGDGSFTSWQPDTSIPVFGLTMGADGQSVYTAMGGAGGKFQRFAPGGSDQPVWSASTDGDATSVSASATALYGGGHYDFVDGQKHKHAAVMSLDGVQKIDEDGDPYLAPVVADNWYAAMNTNEGVFTVEVVPGRMVVFGGNFSEVGYQPDPLNRSNQFLYKPQPGFTMFLGNP